MGIAWVTCPTWVLKLGIFLLTVWCRGSQPGVGVNLIYPRGKFNDAIVHISTALVGKKKQGVNFMLGSWQGVNGRKPLV